MRVTVAIDKKDIRQIRNSLSNVVKNVTKEIGIATSKTSRKGKSLIAKIVAQELATTQKAIKKSIVHRKQWPNATLSVRKDKRIPLKDFKPRQTKKGVSYRISKTTGRTTADSAFMGPRPGVLKISWKGNVIKREGKGRFPIATKFGPSIWWIVLKNKHQIPMIKQKLEGELAKQLFERLRYQRLKKSGAI